MNTKYTVRLKRSAEKELDRLPQAAFDRVIRAIQRLETNPHPTSSKRLRGSDAFRLRVGDYRILYSVEAKSATIDVVAVGHRREVYRGL